MADIRINSLPTTASASSSDDFLALDGATNGTRKLNAYSPTFGGNLTVSGTGTSSFAGVVQVSNTLAAKETNASLTLQPGPGTGGINYAFGQGTGDHVFYGGTTERMRLTYLGNVGIGTTSPLGVLDVRSTTPDVLFNGKDTADPVLYFGRYQYDNVSKSGAAIKYVHGSAGGSQEYGRLAFLTATGSFGALTERMRINESGNVGIGTTSPASLFETSKDSGYQVLLSEYSNNTNRVDLVFRKSRGSAASPATTQVGDYLGIIDFEGRGSSGFTVGAEIFSQVEAVGGSVYGNLIFSTNDLGGGGITERIRLFNNGNFGIGTGSTDGGQKLQVNGSASFAGSIAGTSAALTLTTTASNSNFRIDAIPSGTATSASAVFYNNSAAGSAQYGRIGMLNGTNNVNMVVGTGANSGVAGSLILQTAGTDALTLDSSQNATFAGKVTVNGTDGLLVNKSASVSVITMGEGIAGSYSRLNMRTGSAKYAWSIAAQDLVDNALTIAPSTAVGGTTFTTPVLTVAQSGAVTVSGAIAIGNTVNTVSPTSPNRTITMVIGGTTYYIHAKTTND